MLNETASKLNASVIKISVDFQWPVFRVNQQTQSQEYNSDTQKIKHVDNSSSHKTILHKEESYILFYGSVLLSCAYTFPIWANLFCQCAFYNSCSHLRNEGMWICSEKIYIYIAPITNTCRHTEPQSPNNFCCMVHLNKERK